MYSLTAPTMCNLWFDKIRTEGAFQISVTVRNGQVAEKQIKSLAGGSLRLIYGLDESYQLNGKSNQGSKLERGCKTDEILVLRPV